MSKSESAIVLSLALLSGDWLNGDYRRTTNGSQRKPSSHNDREFRKTQLNRLSLIGFTLRIILLSTAGGGGALAHLARTLRAKRAAPCRNMLIFPSSGRTTPMNRP